ncbi:AI-2E family transporter [Rhizobium sp. KVB221]|uniref:AI-2E family transporter n=1 Tax=Rhizobium setariae TaxID=2801340 RepID=A0A937CL69_9HYPH|nr:AI-2E family transporter [Rhizobium setariae]MBL0371286.1 AI-2E family transporter [Rhizobium setariae]
MISHITGQSLRRQVFFWLVVLALFIAFLMLFSTILLPFVAGMALAYFLDPVADRLESWGLSRMAATAVILLSFIVLLILGLLIIIPLLASQAVDFAEKVPGYITSMQLIVSDANSNYMPTWLKGQMGTLKENLAKYVGEGASFIAGLFVQIWASGKALVDVLSLLVITPVVAFYLLLDWDNMIAKLDSWVPRDWLHVVRRLAGEMDDAIAGFVRGQGTICLILAIFYGGSLSLVGLNFGLLIGIVSGLVSFIPYLGSLLGLVLSVGVALVQFWPDYPWVILIGGIFFFGQVVDGYVLQPKLIGEKVGLHPVWLMFSLLAFGALFGFVGLMVAVPASASIGVLVRYAISRYLESDLYHGEADRIAPAKEAALTAEK